MNANEIIFFKVNNKQKLNEIIKKSAEYAFLSLPFTVDRMNYGLDKISIRINNIFKGKIAEELFFTFCSEKKIPIDNSKCITPYYMTDKRDFLYDNYEFDIKNNFYWDTGNFKDFIKLPALVPNRHPKDQWGKRNNSLFGRKTAFVFTFMKHGEVINGKRYDKFVKIILDDNDYNLLQEKIKQYKGIPLKNEPIDMKNFLNDINIKFTQNEIDYMELIITAYATEEHFPIFKDVAGGTKFLNGVIFTKIVNSAAPIEKLPSFLSLISTNDKNLVKNS
jgi:hypothetical protein